MNYSSTWDHCEGLGVYTVYYNNTQRIRPPVWHRKMFNSDYWELRFQPDEWTVVEITAYDRKHLTPLLRALLEQAGQL